MLSILIPIYNFNVTKMVQTLHEQGIASRIPFEIVCMDDGSIPLIKKENAVINDLKHLIYIELPQNLGRSKIRNALAKVAKFPNLLFLDCDAKVRNPNFLKTYSDHLTANTVLYGGRVYNSIPPPNKKHKLHYYFGKNREESTPQKRQLNSYNAFMTNNFLISKALFLSIQFEETIEGYGHEDTLFGKALEQNKIPIQHLNNPLEHIGLEETTIFLRKQKEAIRNLYLLYQKNTFVETKLLKVFLKLKKWKLHKYVFFVLDHIHNIIDYQLAKQHPNLLWLDLYKLHHLLEIDKNGIDNLSN